MSSDNLTEVTHPASFLEIDLSRNASDFTTTGANDDYLNEIFYNDSTTVNSDEVFGDDYDANSGYKGNLWEAY